ncbi:MAG: two-component sensor histidine kinase [Mojavia pulchra JT2-VF2]|jgi:signal transduction histidine kinase|uniref:histidine kinase n=1 Tax=Mojavia pulchra JT2-VF2 TaxID=287848 RepID=A0A951UFI6_9NOST|nr:two-component sensor histidine kinase [Mojavia pulchra JT2-VF2]
MFAFARSRRNLTYLFALSMGSILVVFAALAYYLGVENQLQAFDEELYSISKAITVNAQRRLYAKRWQVNKNDVFILGDTLPLNGKLVYIRWYNSHKKLIKSSDENTPRRLSFASGFKTIQINDIDKIWLRELTLPIVQNNVVIAYLQIAAPLTPLRDSLNRARLFLTVGVPVTLGLIGITGWFLGGLAMRPTRRAYEQLQRFTADASHELRAPVAAVLSNAQVALMPPEDELEQHFRLENIEKIAKSMSTLISNLLFLARHEGALDTAALKNIDLVLLLRSLTEEYHQQATAQNLNFTSHLPQQSLYLKADPELLKQAIVNLLANAFKYTPDGGTVKLRFLQRNHRAVIQVEDNGIGIPLEDLPHIFERFYRVGNVRSRQTGGFGLGLAISQQIIQAHRGQITANSVLGQGSIFEIQLPLS